MKKSRLKIAVMALLTIGCLLHGGRQVYAQTDSEQQIPDGVLVNGIEIGGMTVTEAEARMEELVSDVCAGSLILTIDNDEIEIPYADFDMHLSDNDVIQEICSIGTSGNLIKRYKELADVSHNKADYQLPFDYDATVLQGIIEEKTEEYNREPQNATLVRHSGEFQITEGVVGLSVDLQATMTAVTETLGETWDGSSQEVAVVTEETQPEHTSDELAVVTDLLGSYSTNYSLSSSNRIANIANGASLIDETVLYPGEIFSFLDHVVPFTTSNGYYEATGYSGGKVVPSIGGGICQVSSTLYNTVLRAELEIVERTNHGLTVSYVPLGADATVSEGSLDFRFQNNLDAPIYIEAYTYGSDVYINIYGHETRPANRTIDFYSVTEQTITPGDDVITEDDTEPEGWQEVTQSAHNGYVASFYKQVYVDGELQETIKLNTSRYSASPRYVTVGTKKPETETEETEEETVATEEPEETPAEEVSPEEPEETPVDDGVTGDDANSDNENNEE